eukprot:scaffold17531_cov241-Isochrysis_galbana.AAC.3
MRGGGGGEGLDFFIMRAWVCLLFVDCAGAASCACAACCALCPLIDLLLCVHRGGSTRRGGTHPHATAHGLRDAIARHNAQPHATLRATRCTCHVVTHTRSTRTRHAHTAAAAHTPCAKQQDNTNKEGPTDEATSTAASR